VENNFFENLRELIFEKVIYLLKEINELLFEKKNDLNYSKKINKNWLIPKNQ